MSTQKITLTFDELHSPAVEEKVKQQAALASAQAASQKAASVPSRLPLPDERGGSLWYNTFFNLTVFGLIGGLLAWGGGELVRYLNPDLRAEADAIRRDYGATLDAWHSQRLSDQRAQQILTQIDERGHSNPWYRVETDKNLSESQRSSQRRQLLARDEVRNRFSEICFYCACGTMIAVALGMAESVASRNTQGAVVYGSVGAMLGLVGGVTVALFIERLYHLIGGGRAATAGSMGGEIIARSISWGVLGLFLSAAPGVVMRNTRKLLFGLIGGFIGGLIGGALFDPVAKWTGSPVLSRLIAIVSIGVITGIATGIIENAAKTGWLKVVRGLIAGKQFIVYRNPTFIGSSPQCEVYLFKDGKVGRRHAALHILPGGYDIEDLGTGAGTLINNRPVTRWRLRNGDQVQIGATCFTFQEKIRT